MTTKKPELNKKGSVIHRSKPGKSQITNSPIDHILYLQRTIGNQAVQRLIKSETGEKRIRYFANNCRQRLLIIPKFVMNLVKEGNLQSKQKQKDLNGSQNKTIECEKSESRFLNFQNISYPSYSPLSGNVAKIDCDIKVHQDDFNNFLLKRDFRVVGTGKPKINILKPEIKSKHPCLFETIMAHEEQHVKNNSQACSDFKKSIDEKSSKPLFGGEPRISYRDFKKCEKKHNGGYMKDCVADEKSAYEAGIKKAKDLLKEKRCKKERTKISESIKYWEKIKDNAPNCKKCSLN